MSDYLTCILYTTIFITKNTRTSRYKITGNAVSDNVAPNH